MSSFTPVSTGWILERCKEMSSNEDKRNDETILQVKIGVEKTHVHREKELLLQKIKLLGEICKDLSCLCDYLDQVIPVVIEAECIEAGMRISELEDLNRVFK